MKICIWMRCRRHWMILWKGENVCARCIMMPITSWYHSICTSQRCLNPPSHNCQRMKARYCIPSALVFFCLFVWLAFLWLDFFYLLWLCLPREKKVCISLFLHHPYTETEIPQSWWNPLVLLWEQQKKCVGEFQRELLKISHVWKDKCHKQCMFWLINDLWTSSFAHGMHKNNISTHSINFKY